jgi:aldose sugar dehydrogenase
MATLFFFPNSKKIFLHPYSYDNWFFSKSSNFTLQLKMDMLLRFNTISASIISTFFALSCIAANCNSTQKGVVNTMSVEQRNANTDYKPAFAGQTRINSIKTTMPYTVVKLTDKLSSPWAIISLPNEKFLVTEKEGKIKVLNSDGNIEKTIDVYPEVDDAGQGGLLDIALDPDFDNNKMIYWSYAEKTNCDSNLMAVAKGKLDIENSSIQSPTVIFRALPYFSSALHYGSRLVFDKDGDLFVSTGERSNPEGRKQAQWLHSGLGKIFKITKEGNPSAKNPFLNKKDTLPHIYAYGIRNCQSLALHPVTGELWEAEFGPRGGDELNIIKAGKNYGWPIITYGIEYGGEPIGDTIQQKTGMEQPVYYWDPTLSPSGMTFYTGNINEWENNLFIGGLSGQHICRLLIKDNKVVGEERLLSEKNERFRDVLCSNGKLYAVTDGGSLFQISKK